MRTLPSIAMRIQQSKGLRLSGGQFERLVEILSEKIVGGQSSEEAEREINSLNNRDIMKLIGEKVV